MFGIGGMELLVILLVALLVLGPERLPEITRWLAKVTREIRRAGDEVRMHLDPDLMEYASRRKSFFNRTSPQENKTEDNLGKDKQLSVESEKDHSSNDKVVFLKKDGE